MKKILKKDIFWAFLVLFFSLLAIRSFFTFGFYPFHDESHIANLYEMTRAIKDRQIPSRWAPDMSFSYGYPLFDFNYPLPFYLGSLFYFFGLSLVSSLKIVFLLTIPLSGISFFIFARKFFDNFFSFATSLLYIYTPYRAVNLYVRGAVGELWAFVFVPLLTWSIVRLIEKKNLSSISITALSLTGLILSHNLSIMIFLPFIIIFGFFLVFSEKEKIKSLLYLVTSFFLGLILSSYFWVPALIERKFALPGTPFNFSDHFPFIRQLIIPSWGYGASVWGPNDGMSFQLGIVNVAVFLISIILAVVFRKLFSQKEKVLFFWLLFAFFVSLFMMNIRSSFIWQLLPITSYIQFPWRFLMVTTLTSSLALGFLSKLPQKFFSKTIAIALIIFAVVLTLNYFQPEKKIQVDDEYYLKKFFADRTVFGKREKISQEYLTYSEDYLPLLIWTKKRPQSVPPKFQVKSREGIDFREEKPTSFLFYTKSEKDLTVDFNSYFFPGWQVEIDGIKIKPHIGEPYGQITFSIPKGNHTGRVYFTETSFRKFFDLISGAGFLFALLFLLLPSFKKCLPTKILRSKNSPDKWKI